jgi:hypothetical protein
MAGPAGELSGLPENEEDLLQEIASQYGELFDRSSYGLAKE